MPTHFPTAFISVPRPEMRKSRNRNRKTTGEININTRTVTVRETRYELCAIRAKCIGVKKQEWNG